MGRGYHINKRYSPKRNLPKTLGTLNAGIFLSRSKKYYFRGSSMVYFWASNKFKYLFFSHSSSHFHECGQNLTDSISFGYIWAKRVWSIPIFTDDDRGLKRLPRSIRGCLLSSEQLQPIGLLFPEPGVDGEELYHLTTIFVQFSLFHALYQGKGWKVSFASMVTKFSPSHGVNF